MSYSAAKNCFTENWQATDPARDPATFNLYRGLIQLTEAIEADQARTQQLLAAILQRLEESRSKK